MLRDPNNGKKISSSGQDSPAEKYILPLSFCLRDSYSIRLHVAPSALIFELLQRNIRVQSLSFKET